MEGSGRSWKDGDETKVLVIPGVNWAVSPGPNCPPRDRDTLTNLRNFFDILLGMAQLTYVNPGGGTVYKC